MPKINRLHIWTMERKPKKIIIKNDWNNLSWFVCWREFHLCILIGRKKAWIPNVYVINIGVMRSTLHLVSAYFIVFKQREERRKHKQIICLLSFLLITIVHAIDSNQRGCITNTQARKSAIWFFDGKILLFFFWLFTCKKKKKMNDFIVCGKPNVPLSWRRNSPTLFYPAKKNDRISKAQEYEIHTINWIIRLCGCCRRVYMIWADFVFDFIYHSYTLTAWHVTYTLLRIKLKEKKTGNNDNVCVCLHFFLLLLLSSFSSSV